MLSRRELITDRFEARKQDTRPRLALRPAKRYDADYFSNIVLTTHEGKRVRFYDDLIRGKIVTINMMYVECKDLCPMMAPNLARVQKLLGDRVGRDIFMYSITLKPEVDTPSALRKYAEAYGVGPGWSFLTGESADIRRLRYLLGFSDPDPAVDRDISTHTGMVRIGNDVYDRWTMSPALADPEQIVATINHLDKAIIHSGGRPIRGVTT